MKQYLLFDLDGTLTDPKVGICTCVQYALASFGIEEPDLDKLEPFIGPPLKNSFMNYYHLTEEQAEEAVEKYRERFKDTGIFENKLYDGIEQMLIALNSKGIHLAVASSKPQVFVERILEHFHIARYFRVVVGSELDGTRVNKEEVIEEALRQLFGDKPVDKSQVYMIGDRRYDAEGAKKVGVESVCVTYGYGSMEELKAAKADYIVRSVEELKNFLLRGTGEKQKLTPTQRILQLFIPFLLFIGVKGLVVNVLGMMMNTVGNTIPAGSFFFVHDEAGNLKELTGNTLTILQMLGFIGGVVAISKIARKTLTRAKDDMKLMHIKGDPVYTYVAAGVAALFAAFGMNLLLELSGMLEASGTYQKVLENQYGSTFILGLILYGLISPFAEELLFRGVLYNCMRRSMTVKMSIFLSAMFFGLYHSNAVQGIYALVLGLLISYAYEYFGDLKVPIAMHMAVNILMYCLSYVTLPAAMTGWAACVAALALAAGAYWLLKREKDIL